MDGDAASVKYFITGVQGIILPLSLNGMPPGEESNVNSSFARMKTAFTYEQIPVIMGEYGIYRRGNSKYVPKDLAPHNDAVDYWLTYVT